MQADGPRNTEEESVVRRAQHGGEEQASTGAPVCAKHGADVCKAQQLQGTVTARHSRVEEKRRSL